jgi:DNA-binding NtrC family response regulator
MRAAHQLPGVLVVEGDVLIRSPLAEYLRDCGYRVLEARNAEEARVILAASPEAVDVALIDARGTPEETGFALAQWLRERHPDVEVVLTGAVQDLTRKASEICDDGPSPVTPNDHRLLLDHIRRLTAARGRRSAG